MRIIGIDPGMAIVGYCLIDVENDCYNVITCGSIQTPKTNSNSERLLEIHNDLKELVEKYKPTMAAIEKLFYFKNAKTIMPVSEARGVIVMTLEQMGVKIFEYTPLEVKQTITGFGRATKPEVATIVSTILNNQKLPKLDDTVDSIAIALCCCRNNRF